MANEVHLTGKNVLHPPPKDRWFVDYLPISGSEELTWYVDGESYATDLHAALTGAAQEICLTGLHFTGNFRLKRTAKCDPAKQDDPDALQEILAARSKAGCEIYLLVNQFWPNEGEVAAGYWRAYRDLDKLLWKMPHAIPGTIMASGGIPDYLEKTFAFFAHLKSKGDPAKIHCYTDIHQGYIFHSNHQKTIIVDRKIAFWGGIDLTDIDGDRWDTAAHTPGNELRNFDKPERSWHDLGMRAVRPQGAKVSAVDYVYANFLARYNHGTLYTLSRNAKKVLEAKQETGFPRLKPPGGKTAQDFVPKERWYYPRQRDRYQKQNVLAWPLVQIVRSMPAGAGGNYARNQHPRWNELRLKVQLNAQSDPFYVHPEFEHSARDAYLKGIAAAEKFIYLENQWVADDRIWAALFAAAEKHGAAADFRLLIVLPKKFLSAAGFGSEQTIDLNPYVEKLVRIFKAKGRPENCGVFSILQPAGHQDPVREQSKVPECVWDYTYVHSKLLVVDDCWALLGSANAGGISLTGLGTTSEPDTELSAIVLDERGNGSLVRQLRQKLWAEHLGVAEADVDDYMKGADLFHAQAKAQDFNTTSAKRVHYNLLYYPSSPKAAAAANKGVWRHLKWEQIQHQVKARVADPDRIHQTYYNLSGPLTAVHMLLERDPSRYETLMANLYKTGVDKACDVRLQLPNPHLHDVPVLVRPQELVEFAVESEHPILEVDWMAGGALTDSANWVLDYQGAVSESVATVCSNGDMVRHLKKLVPCQGGVTHLSCESYGELKEAQRASLLLGTGAPAKPHTVFGAVKIGTALLLQPNEAAVERDKGVANRDLGDPKYWISRVTDNPWLQLKRDRAYPLYPGVLTPYDVKHILGDKMYVRLLQPLEFKYDGDTITDVRMSFWTWGCRSTLEVPAALFAKQAFGFFIGYYTNAARSRAEEKLTLRAEQVKLKAGWQRDYRHDDVDGSKLTVTCASGSLRVQLSRRVWSKWEVVQTVDVGAGQSLPLQIAEASSVNDQDNLARITATADAEYSLEMKSWT
jgi:phosphatidylserine/phosphatidylglycerophosphate/cardiolipin synthase-like enzyme